MRTQRDDELKTGGSKSKGTHKLKNRDDFAAVYEGQKMQFLEQACAMVIQQQWKRKMRKRQRQRDFSPSPTHKDMGVRHREYQMLK